MRTEKYIAIPVFLINIVVISAIFLLLEVPSSEVLQRHLAIWNVRALDLAWLTAIIGLIVEFKHIREHFSFLSRHQRLLLLGLLLGSTVLVTLIAPKTNRIFYDEHIYQSIAQSIAKKGEAVLCKYCEAEEGEFRIIKKEINKQPNGHPHYLSLFFRLLGVHESSAHLANNAAYLLGIVAVFTLVILVFKSVHAALFSATFFAITPMTILWSNTAAAEPSAAAFAACSLAAASWFITKPSTGGALLLGGVLGFSAQFRPESLLLPLPIVCMVLLLRPRLLLDQKIYWSAFLALFFVTPLLLHLYSFRNHDWGSSGERFSFDVFWDNISVNGPYYFRNIRFPALFAALAVLGALTGSSIRRSLPILVWFAYSWGIFLFFYAGSYNYGADVRYALISAAPIAIFAGLGFTRICESLRPLRSMRVHTVVPVAVIFFLWSQFLPLIRSVGSEAFLSRYDVQAARTFVDHAPPGSVVLSHNPNMWLLWGKNAAQTSEVLFDAELVTTHFFRKYHGGVYFHRSAWCNVENKIQNRFCDEIVERFELSPVVEKEYFGKTFGLYQLSPRRGVGGKGKSREVGSSENK